MTAETILYMVPTEMIIYVNVMISTHRLYNPYRGLYCPIGKYMYDLRICHDMNTSIQLPDKQGY